MTEPYPMATTQHLLRYAYKEHHHETRYASGAHTMTLGAANAGTQIASSVAVPNDDARLRIRGGAAQKAATFPNELRGYGITNTAAAPHFEVEFMYDGERLEFEERGGGQRYTSLINDVLGEPSEKVPADGNSYHRLIDFGSRGVRRVRVQLNNLVGVKIEPGATLWPAPSVGDRTIVLGASFAEGTGGYLYGGFVIHMGLLAGLDAWASGVGATGILADGGGANGKVKFRDRVQSDVVAFSPARVVIAGGINDSAADPATYRAEYDLLLSELQTSLPSAEIVAVGPFWPRTPGATNNILAIRDATRDAALAAGVQFVDGFVFTNANEPRYISSDGTHPNAAGHEYLGRRMAESVAPESAAGANHSHEEYALAGHSHVKLDALPGAETEQRVVYVSPSGSDTSGDGTSANPWRTVQYAIDQSQAMLARRRGTSAYKIVCATGTYDEPIVVPPNLFAAMNTAGQGGIWITSATGNAADVLLTSTDPSRAILLYGSATAERVTIENDARAMQALGGPSVMGYLAEVTVRRRSLSDGGSAAIDASTGSVVVSKNITSVAGRRFSYGLYATYGAVIAKSGPQPGASVAAEFVNHGGAIR